MENQDVPRDIRKYKMLIDSDVVLIGHVDPDKIEHGLKLCNQANWAHEKYDRFEPPLKDGRLCMMPYVMIRDYQKNHTQDQLDLIDSMYPIVDTVMTYFPGYKPVRGEVVNLLPGKQLELHVDIFWFHKFSKRIHVPIYTNDSCVQIFEDREVHLETGNIYEINNRIMHSARNSGTEPRFHLILDLMSLDDIEHAKANPGLAGSIVPE